MQYTGNALRVETLASGIAHLVFDLQGSSVNKFNQAGLVELQEAVQALAAADIKGVIFSSAKSSFIVGADITEFNAIFAGERQQIIAWLEHANRIFSAIEDLPVPTVCAIDGAAMGGGMEMAICTDYRVATVNAVLGFPEVKLGILPGFGGTVRMPRLIGADNANQWISSGSHIKAEQAFKEGALDAIVEKELLLEAAQDIINQCNAGKLDYQAVRARKISPLALDGMELDVAFDVATGLVAARAGPNYPAPVTAVKVMHKAARLDRAGALEVEHEGFADLAKTEVAANLVQMFLNDQFLAAKAKSYATVADPVKLAAVLGAGIMGGGIAYQSALKGTPIIMKDIAQEGIDLGMAEAQKLLSKRVSRGRLSNEKMIAALSSITPSLDYHGFDKVDVVVEAVVENPKVKKSVLGELEDVVRDDAIMASNTSTISIDLLAQDLKRPEKFCGMHFFNPVPVMPLVEVIRGEKSSDATIASVVTFARQLGKTPIVVNNCPGFLVNRILFPYFGAFSRLIHDGAEFRQIDKAMQRFGWPMGPAYLLDVVGLDTAVHGQAVMAEGFPDRMQMDFQSAIDVLYENKRLGQKTGSGFYRYETDKRGKPKKMSDPAVDSLLASVQSQQRDFDDQEIVDRMMIAMALEAARCLEDGIVDSAIEVDMGLVLGLGFPAFRGGALRYIDSVGVAEFCQLADKYADLGAFNKVTEKLREMAAKGEKFYPG